MVLENRAGVQCSWRDDGKFRQTQVGASIRNQLQLLEWFSALHRREGERTGSTVLQRKGPNMLARDFKPGFRVELHDKDMGIVTAAAREAGVVIPLGAVAAQLVASLKAQGDGGLDHSALLKLVTQLSGRQERQE